VKAKRAKKHFHVPPPGRAHEVLVKYVRAKEKRRARKHDEF
jgi:hypothetical protein